jgi:hypothetical protein
VTRPLTALALLLAVLVAAVLTGCARQYPLTPAQPWADIYGDSLCFFTFTTDPKGLKVQYIFDWGDGASTTTDRVPSGDTAHSTHGFSMNGSHNVRVAARNEKGLHSSWSAPLAFYSSQPPLAGESIAGPERWAPDRWYHASLEVTDPEGDSVSAKFIWDDTVSSGWTPFAPSGSTITDSCRWMTAGRHAVKVVLKDRGSMVSSPDLDKTVSVSRTAIPWVNSDLYAESSPVLGSADGHLVICGVGDGEAWCANPDGTARWTWRNDSLSSDYSPSVSTDASRLYVANDSCGLLCFDVAAGTVLWRLEQQDGGCTPVLGPDGVVYVTGGQNVTRVRDLGDSARVEWTFSSGHGAHTNVVLGANGTIYGVSFGDWRERRVLLFALDSAGLLLWQDDESVAEGADGAYCPAMDSRGRLLVTSNWDSLACFNFDGSLAWRASVPYVYAGGISVGYDDRIYVQGPGDYILYCLDSAGRLIWSCQTEYFPGAQSNLSALSDSTVLSISQEDFITCVGWDGRVAWEFNIDDSLGLRHVAGGGHDEGDERPTPVVAPDGNVYMCCDDGLLCLALGSTVLANTAWPTYAHDNARSGWAGRPMR